MKALRSCRWLASAVALLLLLGTAAPALERMSCSMGCPTVIGIGQVEDCCSGELDHHDGPVLSSTCCELERTAPEHQAFTTERVMPGFTFIASAELPVPPVPCLLDGAPHSGCTPSPPPLLLGERLSRVGSYLI
jgi:hypothetical protein